MVTIKDIAKYAHVSSGTVSNVINKKGNVSVEKIRLVEEAIQELGYSVNESAHTLRSKEKKSIFLIVPDMRSPSYISFYNSILKLTRAYGYSVEIYDTHNLYGNEKNLIQKAISKNVSYIISFPTYINSYIYNTIPASINVILVGPRPEGITRNILVATFDYEQVADDISSYLIHKKKKNIALFVDSVRFSKDFVLVTLQNLRKKNINVTTYGSTPHNAVLKAFDFCDPANKFDAIITSNILRANAVQLAYSYTAPEGLQPEIITLSSSNSLFDNNFTSVFFNYTKLGNMVGERIINNKNSAPLNDNNIVLLTEPLIKKEVPITKSLTPQTIHIYGQSNTCFLSLKKILPQFEQLSGISVEMHIFNHPDTEPLPKAIIDKADIIISNVNTLSIEKNSPFLSKKDAPNLWDSLNEYIDAKETYFPEQSREHCCFSFNVSGHLLFYRTDLFSKQEFIREFYEQNNHSLDIPKTIRDFETVSRFFTKSLNPFSQIMNGGSMSSLSNESALYELAIFLSAHLDLSRKKSININYASKDTEDAIISYLQQLKASNASTSNQLISAIDDYISGDSIMSFLSTANAPIFNENTYHTISDCTKACYLNSGAPIINYGVIGVGINCQNQDSALQFLKWVYQDSISEMITLISGQPIKKNSTQNSNILSQYPWLDFFDELMEKGLLLTDIFPPYFFRTDLASRLLDSLSTALFNIKDLQSLLLNIQNDASSAKYILK